MIRLREANKSDIPALRDVFRESITHVCKADYSPEEILDWMSCGDDAGHWEELMHRLHFIVAQTTEKEITGFASVSTDGYLHSMFVNPHNLRRGVASALCVQAEQYAAKHGVPRMESDVSITAKPFFEKQGYRTDLRKTQKANELYLTNYKMSKTLPQQEQQTMESHPLDFFLPKNAHVLMMGSFPPKRERWSMEFFYPNLQNDMWRVFGLVFFDEREHFLLPGKKAFDKEKIMAFLQEKSIALGDTANKVIRLKDNASDKFLQVAEPFDVVTTLQKLPCCTALVTTGEKATDTLISLIGAPQPKVGGFSTFDFAGREMRLYRMPSTSRAYPKPLEQKAEVYGRMFEELGIK